MENVELKEEINLEIKKIDHSNKGNNNGSKQIAGAIVLAGIIIAGAVLLKDSKTTPTSNNIKILDEGKLTKAVPIFSACLDSDKYAQAVTDATTAAGKNGVQGTPKGFILSDGKVVSTIDGAEPTLMVTQKIDDALSGKAKAIKNIKIDPISSSDFLQGNPNAKVAIVLYTDFQCPFCGKFFKDTEETAINSYLEQEKVMFVHRDFAFLGIESQKAAEATRCAADQGKFWEYYNYLYNHQNGENQGAFANVNLKSFAKELGLK